MLPHTDTKAIFKLGRRTKKFEKPWSKWPLLLLRNLPLPMHFINRFTWESSEHYIITTVMAPSTRVTLTCTQGSHCCFFSTQIWFYSSSSGCLGLILTNPVKSGFFEDINLASGYSKSNNIRNVSSCHYSVRKQSSGEKRQKYSHIGGTKRFRQSVSHSYTSINIKYFRLLTIRYNQSCNCGYNKGNMNK